jgi:acyl CoA:acetate/3-ketoacid CoA transferase beta subunit
MNNYVINVEPKEFITSYTSKSAEMRVCNLDIGSSVTVNVVLKDTNNNIFRVENVTLSGEDYENWGNSDVYLVTTVLSKLGLIPTPNPPPVPN